MFEVFILYLITRLDSLKAVSQFFMVCGTIVLVLFAIGYFATKVDKDEVPNKIFSDALGYTKYVILSYIIFIATPTQEDVKFIIAGTGLIEMAKSDTAKNIAGKSVTIVEKYLDKIENSIETKKEEK